MSGPIHIISLGAGVQSSTMTLMAKHGEIAPMPDAAIFADTQWEPKAVYEWLGWLTRQLPFPVLRVTAGNLRADTLSRSNTSGKPFAAIPWFMKMPGRWRVWENEDGTKEKIWFSGNAAMGRRQCTKEYKLRPIQRKVVELLGGHRPKQGCTLWIGISIDEASRMKPSRVQYIQNRWPLIERLFTRSDCLRWMKSKGYPPPPRSACIGCPFHNDTEWREIKANPETWADAVEVDKAIRTQPGFRGEQYAHRSLLPLAEVDFRSDEARGQLNFFGNECEGMCGV